jgi:signal transduction histidine kinase/ActR/RegA family two-component response regulator
MNRSTHTLPEAPGPLWAWVVVSLAVVVALAYVRLVIFPFDFVPLAYGLPVLLFLWRRDLRLLWGTTGGLGLILLNKLYALVLAQPAAVGRTMLFGSMQLASLLATAVAVHLVIILVRRLDNAQRELEASNLELEASNEELAAREEEILQQNEELQSQATELEQQTEELTAQSEEIQEISEQLAARERMLNDLVAISASGAGEAEVLIGLGEALRRLLEPRAAAAAILERRGDEMVVHSLCGMAEGAHTIARARTLADIVIAEDRAGSLSDVALRRDLLTPTLEDGAQPRTLIAASLRMPGPTSAALEIYGQEPGDWSDLELRLVQWCAEQCGRIWAMARLREDLERLADSERTARAEVEHASREKDEFVATLAHELRTPIGAVLGWATLLRMAGEDPDERERALQVIERNAHQQNQLISDLLDINQAVAGKLRLELRPLDPVQVIDAAVDAVRPAADARGVRFQVDLEVTDRRVLADAARLEQIVWNLLSNAVKFSEPGATVTIRATREDGSVCITVADTGQGIDPRIIPDLFQRYRQADSSSTRRHGGLGLGLAIVKHLVDLHNGTVHLHSDGPGRGARCTVALPVADARDPAALDGAAPPDADGAGLEATSVLLVDDDPDTLEFLARILRERGAAVTTASSAVDALEMLEAERPGLLISDIGMPNMDGLEFIRRVRRMHQASELPAIAITAFGRVQDRERALDSGFQVHLPKPVNLTALFAAVASLRRAPAPAGGERAGHGRT